MVHIIMGSPSDLPVMSKAGVIFEEYGIPYEVFVMSAHRSLDLVQEHIKNCDAKVIIAGAGGAAHLPGVIAGMTITPVIGVPIKSSDSIDGWDSILSILQMPSGVPVATVALDNAANAGILAIQMLAISNEDLKAKLRLMKQKMNDKIKNIKVNKDFSLRV